MVVKATQLNIKIGNTEKETLEEGARLNNENLSSFIRRSALKKAKSLINQEEVA